VKKLVYSVFVAFWAGVATIVVLELLRPENVFDGNTIDSAEFSIPEVAEHDTFDDCWMVIEGKVYDFSDYIDQHPAPPAVMGSWCGTDATEGMRTKGVGRNHSSAAWALMDQYRIGRLDQTE